MDDRAGQQQVLPGAVDAGQADAGRRHRTHVLEQPATVGVVNLLRGRPLPERRAVIGENPREEHLQRGVRHGLHHRGELGPHVAHRARCARDAVLLAEPLGLVLRGVDAANRRRHQLELAVVDARPPLDADELPHVELALEAVDAVEDPAGERAAGILQDEGEVLAVLADTHVLADAQEVAPAQLVWLQLGYSGQAGRHRRSVHQSGALQPWSVRQCVGALAAATISLDALLK